MKLVIVTPAYGRFELSSICFEQRALVLEELRARGQKVEQIVVADDENLDLARSFDFHALERPNDWLGLRVNEGWEHAIRALDADWVTYVGSDSWIKPEIFLHPWNERVVYTGTPYSVVDSRGLRLLVSHVTDRYGVGPHAIHRNLTKMFRTPFRPAGDTLKKGIDGSICHSVDKVCARYVNADRSPIVSAWEAIDVDDYQYVGFRSEQNITSYEQLRLRWGVREERFRVLRDHYPEVVVTKMRDFYAGRR